MKSIMILVIIIFTFSSCKDNSISSSVGGFPTYQIPAFNLKITVKNFVGMPVPNLRISGGSLIPFDIQGQGYQGWTNGIYETRLSADDSSGLPLYRRSILIVFGDVDISNPPSILGFTSSSGELTLNNALRFPGIINLPQLNITGPNDPTILGVFSMSTTAKFVIYDTVTHQKQIVQKVLQAGDNIINVQWNPTTVDKNSHQSETYDLGDNKIPASPLASTSIRFDVPKKAKINLSIVQLDGTTLSTLVNQYLWAGIYMTILSTDSLRSAIQPNDKTNQVNVNGIKFFLSVADTGVVPIEPGPVPKEFRLYQNYPNPFN